MKQKVLNLYFRFFGILAKIYIFRQKPFIIGITGSIGKTSCRMIISQILEKNLKDKKIYTSSKNFNGELGLSLSVLGISDYEPEFSSVLKTIFKSLFVSLFGKKLYDIIVLEYGIDHKGEMDFLLSIVKPDVGIVTKIDKVHSSQFESKEIIASEKYKLLKNSKNFCFLNVEDEFAKIYEKEIVVQKYFYTTNSTETSKEIDLVGKKYTLKFDKNTIKSNFDFYFKNEKKINISSNLIGEENIGYINIGIFILDFLFEKYYKKTFFVLKDLKLDLKFELQYSRFSIFNGKNNSVLVDSSYNAAPESMKKVIENFLKLHKTVFSDYEIILCLGEMRELGEYVKVEHEKLALFTRDITKNIFVVGESMKNYFLKKSPNAKHFKNSKLLGEFLKDFLKSQEKKYLILFKGSQNTIFMEEAISQILENKKDIKKLCRQEDFWLEKKEKYFLT